MATHAIDLTSDDGYTDAAEAAADQGVGVADVDVSQLEEQLQQVEEELLDVEESLQALHSRQSELRKEREELQRRIAAEKRAPRADWQNTHFPWDAQLQQALSTVFGLSAFRPLQREVMNATLHGRDVLVLMPSGGGKSLCYQLPAVISGGVTLVISPLLSLIVDQVMCLQGRVQAYSLTSLTSKEEAAAVMNALTAVAAKPSKHKAATAAAGSVQQDGCMLLYCTPEKIVASKRLMSKLEKIYQAGKLARIAVDECHCASTWGNDFRPDYKKLGVLKQQFPDTPIIALTATATTQVCKDVVSILGVAGAEHFAASINRPNLRYEVRHKPAGAAEEFEELRSWIATNYPRAAEQGIVYCLTRKDCEQLADKLNGAGISAAHYHADMEPGARAASHSTWSDGGVKVMVATIAFGMGINKPNVRFVIHACLSKSLENYYQESGRAGRDGEPARCVLFYRLPDVLRQASVVCMDHGWQRHLMSVMSYAAATRGCRRAILAAHFAEPPPSCNGTCDLCAARAARGQQQQQEQEDVTAAALVVIKLLKERKGEKRATLNQLLDDLQKASRKQPPSGSGGSGCLASRDEQEWLVQEMLLQGLLGFEFGFTAYNTNTYLAVTAFGESVAAANGRNRLLATQPMWLRSKQPQQQKVAGTRKRQSSSRAHGPTRGGSDADALEEVNGEDDDDSFMAGMPVAARKKHSSRQ